VKREGARDAHVTLKIPRPLYDQLKQVIQGSGFHSVTEFAVYVLRDLVSHRSEAARYGLRPDPAGASEEVQEAQQGQEGQEDIEPLSPDEIEAIRKRLSSLGYL
jgi:hypothetical protein